jgi:hypothetical protein
MDVPVLAVDTNLALIVRIGWFQYYPSYKKMTRLKFRPFKGVFSTNRSPMRVLAEASEVLSAGCSPKR